MTLTARVTVTSPSPMMLHFANINRAWLDLPQKTPSKKQEDDSPTNHKREEHSPILKKIGATLQSRSAFFSSVFHSASHRRFRSDNRGYDFARCTVSILNPLNLLPASKPPPNPNFASAPMASIVKNGLPPKPPGALPFRYATAAAAAVNSSSNSIRNTANNDNYDGSISERDIKCDAFRDCSAPNFIPLQTALSRHYRLCRCLQHSPHKTNCLPVTSSPSLTHPSVSAPRPNAFVGCVNVRARC